MLKSIIFITALALNTNLLAHQHSEHKQHNVSKEQARIEHGVIRAYLPVAKSTTAYFDLTNTTSNPLTLTKATIEGIGRVEIHEHTHANGMMKMQQINVLNLAPQQTIKFETGGYHLMAFEPKKPLKVGEQRTLTLYFDNNQTATAQIKVISLKDAFKDKQTKDKDAHSHHHH
jgi:copper(I)-binding protein